MGLHASRDSLYRTARGERQRRPGVIPLELLPRRCPVCHNDTIIGHGRRLRQGHDDWHAWIWVRRGICQPCRKTFTILPNWLAPSGHYSLRCRQLACERICSGDSVEQAVPDCQDPSRLPSSGAMLARRFRYSPKSYRKLSRVRFLARLSANFMERTFLARYEPPGSLSIASSVRPGPTRLGGTVSAW